MKLTILLILLMIPLVQAGYIKADFTIENGNVTINDNRFSCNTNLETYLYFKTEDCDEFKLDKCKEDLSNKTIDLEICNKVTKEINGINIDNYKEKLNDFETCKIERNDLKEENTNYKIIAIIEGCIAFIFIILFLIWFSIDHK